MCLNEACELKWWVGLPGNRMKQFQRNRFREPLSSASVCKRISVGSSKIMCLEMPIWISEGMYGASFFVWNCRHYRRYKFIECNRALLSFLFPTLLAGVKIWFIYFISFVYLICLVYLPRICQYFQQVNLSLLIAIALDEYRYIHVCNTCRNKSLRNIISIRCVSLGEGQREKSG